MNERQKFEKQYAGARANLLMMTLLTCVNVVLLALRTGTTFLFSASIPQVAYAFFSTGARDQSASGLLIGALFIGLFLLCYFLSKGNPHWMTAAAALFALDTLFLVVWLIAYTDSLLSNVMDILFHGWVLYYLILGVRAARKLAKLPVQTANDAFETPPAPQQTAARPPMQETPLGMHDGGGDRLLAAEYGGLQIAVFRQDMDTLLVVNGQIYSRWHGLMEHRYTLTARVEGVPIVCTYTTENVQSGLMRLYAGGQPLDECRRPR